jgi:uncharacterized protein YecE (DUF72 family)
MKLYVGTSGYSYAAWKGSFYPEKLPAKKMLEYYGEHFRTVEINYTFKRLPTAAILKTWTESVPADFRFALKAPEWITHRKRLKDAGDMLAKFLEVAARLKRRRGPLLFQLPPNFKKDVQRLHAFLQILPAKHRAAFEFRHASWFDDEVFQLLRDHNVALCIADADDDLQVPAVATTDWGCLRLRRAEYDNPALKKWWKQIRAFDWKESFVFFKHEDEAKGPAFAQRLLKLAK